MTMTYRTKTYIAADWTGDTDAIDQLHKWNDSNYWGLSFNDAHDITQSNDSSLNCSIKASLAMRLDVSKTFVLIVGRNTKSLTSGACFLCAGYSKDFYGNIKCNNGHSISNKSFIEYECDKAVRDELNIVVLYNAATIDKSKCPDAVKNTGNHKAMCYYQNGKYYWDYQTVKTALGQ
ncbi:hypothetical protein FACS1894151_02090 [Spirochaetia bacterium]|nr:hypothetical protein FACS1894151_02090 [Spirochaetia bacterium]